MLRLNGCEKGFNNNEFGAESLAKSEGGSAKC